MRFFYLNKGFIMMKKLFFLSFVFITLSLNAQIINKIVVLVNNEPITQVDIIKAAQRQKTDEANAVNLLIKEKIISNTCKKYNILANDDEINSQLLYIAQKNKLNSIDELDLALKQDGASIDELKEKIAFEINKQKLFSAIASSVKHPSEDEINAYKNSHHNLNGVNDDDIANIIYNEKTQEEIKSFLEKEQLKTNIKFLSK